MHFLDRPITLLISLLFSLQSFAKLFDDVTIDNIVYSYENGHAVAANGKNASGSVTLPKEVTFKRQEFKDGQWTDVTKTVPVTKVAGSCFIDNAKITYISFNENVTTIGGSAFKGCKLLCAGASSTLKIPKSVTSVGLNAFKESGIREACWETNISIPDGAFYNCANLVSIKFNSTSGIGEFAFSGCTSLKSISIPQSCTTIGKSSFWGCTALTGAKFHKKLNLIGESAFRKSGLISIEFGEGCENLTIDQYAFAGCSELKSITFLEGKQIIIQELAFYNIPKLERINFANGVTVIGAGNFCYCPILENFQLPNTIEAVGIRHDEHIPLGCFNNCQSLTKIDLPANVADKTIELYYSFCECETLKEATKAPNQNYIDDKCFQLCPMLGAVTTRKPSPSNVISRASRANAKTIIRNGSFDGCENLERFDCEFSLEEGGGFMWCNRLKFDTYHIPYNEIVPTRATPSCFVKHVTMPISVRQLNQEAIPYAGTVSIPDFLRIIYNRALYASEMTEIVLPDSLHSVYEFCIAAPKLQKLKMKSEIPPVFRKYDGSPYTLAELINSGPYIISSAYNIPLYVPKGTAEAYKNAPGWSKFKEIIEYGENSAVDDISITAPTVSVEGGRIVVSGSVPVMIFNLSGILLYNGNSDNIPALPKGLYIVKAAATTTKISL